MEESRAVGKRIEALRRKKGLTQEKLAEQVGLSMKHIGEIERGRVNPTLASLAGISKALEISLMDLFDFEHERLTAAQIRVELDRMVKGATDEECRTLYRILKAVVE
jgi:XRE family aerobic/anaerobic benzoate catabolism transcriptional regulator